LSEIGGCSIHFEGPHFKEIVLTTPIAGSDLVRGLAGRGFLAGPALGQWFPELGNAVLLAATEQRNADDIERLAEAIEKELAER
jgi:glycine dehydrogenase subunit 1